MNVAPIARIATVRKRRIMIPPQVRVRGSAQIRIAPLHGHNRLSCIDCFSDPGHLQDLSTPIWHGNRCPNYSRVVLGHESLDVTLAYLKGKDAESEEAQEYANSSSLALYA